MKGKVPMKYKKYHFSQSSDKSSNFCAGGQHTKIHIGIKYTRIHVHKKQQHYKVLQSFKSANLFS